MTLLRKFTRALLVLVSIPLIGTAPAHAQENSEPPKLTLTTIDVPGAAVTEVNGINPTGDMVGAEGPSTFGPLSGFIYSGGAFTYFNYPGQSVTYPGGINDSNLVVGYATQNAGEGAPVYGFLYDGATFTTLQDGSDSATFAFGLNNAGTVVGRAGSLGAATAFELQSDQYRTVKLPGPCTYKNAVGINNLGEIVGYTVCGLYENGYAVRNGKLQNVDFPGATQTAVFGINDSGIIVGWYGSGAFIYAFAYLNGKYISFSYPGAEYTAASGINKSGQIVGSYTPDVQTTWHGFVTSPITPADFDRPGCCRVSTVEAR